MPQTIVTNHTVGKHEILLTQDENMEPIVAPIVKATFDISPMGELRFADTQVPIDMDGKYNGDPQSSSYIYEPELSFTKPLTDIVIIADAISRAGAVDRLPVTLRLGAVEKKFMVFGDRHWQSQQLNAVPSVPQIFKRMPLVYENAFGGWDIRSKDQKLHRFEARNTVGKGMFNKKAGKLTEKLALPNVEYASQLIDDIEQTPVPAACGFTLPHWQPRAKFAGTYDPQWQASRNPLLPKDFDRRFYNAASEGLCFNFDEIPHMPVACSNVTALGNIAFNLPKIRPPVCEINLKSHTEQLTLNLDTVIINFNEMKMFYIWRNFLVLERGPHDCQSIHIYNG